MGALHLTASHMNRGSHDLVGRKLLHKQTYSSDICHRVHCADFVEMYLSYRDTVGVAFRLCNKSVHCKNVLPYFFGHVQMGHDMLDIVHTAVVVSVMMFMLVMVVMLMVMVVMVSVCIFIVVVIVFMLVVVLVMVVMLMLMVVSVVMLVMVMMLVDVFIFLHAVHGHRNVCACYAALDAFLASEFHTGDTQSVQTL